MPEVGRPAITALQHNAAEGRHAPCTIHSDACAGAKIGDYGIDRRDALVVRLRVSSAGEARGPQGSARPTSVSTKYTNNSATGARS